MAVDVAQLPRPSKPINKVGSKMLGIDKFGTATVLRNDEVSAPSDIKLNGKYGIRFDDPTFYSN